MYSYYDTSEFLNAPYGAEYLEQGRNNLFRPLRGLILL